jgi:DNA-directed RNA polymerase sigma subunit (sigma70/sigma32)
VAERLSTLRTYRGGDLPRGTLDLTESICALREAAEDDGTACNLQEHQVDPDRLYSRLFEECPLMKREETQRLLHALADLRPEDRIGSRKDDYLRLRNRLILGHIRLCVDVIKHYGLRRKCLSLGWDDLIQEEIFGLARAIDRFDLGQGTEFSTYAYPWIRQGITRPIETKDRLIRIPTHCWRGKNRLSDHQWQRFNKIFSLSANECGARHEPAAHSGDIPPNHLIRLEFEHTVTERNGTS